MSKNSEQVKTWRRRFRLRIVAAMGEKCACCGYDRCDKALDVHHIDDRTKDFNFADKRARPSEFSELKSELQKCVLVCKVCHIEIHAEVRASPTISSFDAAIFAQQVAEEQPRANGRFATFKQSATFV